MFSTNRFVAIAKKVVILSASLTMGALMLSACSDKEASTTKSTPGERTTFEISTDHAMGNFKAPVTVVEYASVTCGACSNWHTTIWPDFQAKYVATGKVRYVYREFPTGNVSLANAGHLLANCASEDKFFDLIAVQMKRQRQILTSNDIKGEYVALAKSVGMSEADFDACMANQTEMDRLQTVLDGGVNAGVTGTPTFFINDKKEQVFTIEDFEKIIAPLLGEPVPTAKSDASTKPEKADH